MKSGRMKEYIPFVAFMMAFILMSFMLLLPGCSKKATDEKDDAEYTASAVNEADEEPVFSPVKEKILQSIQETYKDSGVKIVSIEISARPKDLANIELSYPGHSSNQAIMAGLSILWDNFPKLSGYSSSAGGKEVSAIPDNLAFVKSNGYSLGCSDEDAAKYLEIVVNGPSAGSMDSMKAQVE